jgi:tyrosyl-tRNA synthetase
MELKKRLAWKLVEIYHDSATADRAQSSFEKQFSKREVPEEVPELAVEFDEEGKAWLPRIVKDSGVVSSSSAAIRLIKQGGIKINGDAVTDKDYNVMSGKDIIIKIGKKNYFRVVKKG